MKLRHLKKSDLRKASHIVGQNYSKKYEVMAFNEMRASFMDYPIKPAYIVAEEKGEIIGVAGYVQSWMDYDIYEIFWVNVSPDYQGQGVGSALINKAISIIKRKEPKTILLTTDKPKFYANKFDFKLLSKFKNNNYNLMALKLKK